MKDTMKVIPLMRCCLPLVLTFVLILQACHQTGNNDSVTAESDQDIIKKEVILSPETQDLLNRFPTPFEVTKMLQEAKAPYLFSFTNPPDNVNRYFTEKTKALNLGIYSTDLAYSSTYQRNDLAEKFLYCTGKLAGDLGIGSVYDKRLLEKAKNYHGSRDSLVVLMEQFFVNTNDFLRRNNRTQVAVLVAAGAFVEGLYIASSLCRLTQDNSRIASTIYSQKESLDKLSRILAEYGTDSTIQPVADEFAKLKTVFTSYGLGSGKTIPSRNVEGIVNLVQAVRSSVIR